MFEYQYNRTLRLTLFLLLGCLVSCSGFSNRIPVANDLENGVIEEEILGAIRFWGDRVPENIVELTKTRMSQIEDSNNGTLPHISNYLAISGGAEDGAFGAGLLCGWTESGYRPEFEVVTGISTGALIAPFAFLGSEYDNDLEFLFTQTSTKNILITSFWRKINAVVGYSALTDTSPLSKKIDKVVTKTLFEKIAVEHLKGRRLYIGTTNLDAQRPVVWDIGALANSQHPFALKIFKDILLASASIPGAMPPVFFNVYDNNKLLQEMHVDGGVTSQVFFYPMSLDIKKLNSLISPNRRLYIIRNSKVGAEYKHTKNNTLSIVGRSIQTLIKSQGIGDLYKILFVAKRDSFEYKLAYIEDDFKHDSNELFDPIYMKALFDYGFEKSKTGYNWYNSP